MRWIKIFGIGQCLAIGLLSSNGAVAESLPAPTYNQAAVNAFGFYEEDASPSPAVNQVSYEYGCSDSPSCAAGCDSGSVCGDLCCDDGCCDCIGGWQDNTVVFFAGDAWKGFGEIPANGYGNNFGLRTGVNSGFGLGDSGLRFQLGASVGFYDFYGRSLADQQQIETQFFVTGGVYKRSDIECCDPWSYGVVWDVMSDNNYGVLGDDVTLSQVRGQMGYALSECNEVGVWGAFRATDDTLDRLGAPVRTVNQVNLFWHHNWAFGGDTTIYGGYADGLSDATFGLLGNAPLSYNVALFGAFNYYAPSATAGPAGATEEFWNVTFGLSWYPGSKAVNKTVSGWKGMPLLDVANNGTFQLTPKP